MHLGGWRSLPGEGCAVVQAETIVIGLDLGTTNWKAVAYDQESLPLARFKQPVAVHEERTAEPYDPEAIWGFVVRALRERVNQLGPRSRWRGERWPGCGATRCRQPAMSTGRPGPSCRVPTWRSGTAPSTSSTCSYTRPWHRSTPASSSCDHHGGGRQDAPTSSPRRESPSDGRAQLFQKAQLAQEMEDGEAVPYFLGRLQGDLDELG